jgi:hypothetical protein
MRPLPARCDKEETERVYEVRYYDTKLLAGSAPNAAGSAR